jgi:hypothetical protein
MRCIVSIGCVLVVAVGGPWHCAGDDAKEGETAALVVVNRYIRPAPVLVTLYCQGKPVRSKELTKAEKEPAKVRWAGLPVGTYEIHFEAEGYKPFVKRFVLAKDDKDFEVLVRLSKDGAIVGGGPSLDALGDRVRKLEQANADLRAQVERLQQEIAQLKKK